MTGNDFVALAANAIDHAVLLTDAGGAIVFSNPAFREMFGYVADDVIGRIATEMLAQDGFDTGVIERARQELGQGRVFSEEVPVTSKNGKQVWVAATVKPIFDSAGRLQNFLLVYSDINESKQIQSLQRDVLGAIAEDRPVRDVMELIATRVEAIAPDVVCSILAVDEDQRLRPLSAPQLPAVFSEAVDGLKIGPRAGSCGTAAFRGEPVLVTDIDTDPLWEDYKGLPIPFGLLACWSSPIMLRNGRVAGTFAFYYRQKQGPTAWHQHIVTACVDLCVIALERHEAKTRIAQLAYYDNLTGLPNRTLLREELVKSFDDVASPEAALIFLDIDRFKDVNDTLGHAVGDGFLKEIAERLKAAVWDVDFISRHGGDEFVIVLRGADAPRAKVVAEKLLKAIDAPVVINGLALPASASIGIAVCPQDGRDAATLLRNADTAMYSAKADGRGTYRFFTAEMNRVAQDRLLLGSALRDAVENNELTLHYQPKIDARTGELAGVEALSRWTHPVLGHVSPDRFIPLAEDFGVIDRIGEFCIAEACHQLRAWDAQGLDVRNVAVNISPLHFRDPALPGYIEATLKAFDLEPERLTVEITESVMMDAYPTAIANARRLRESGVCISMDDFGTGYSSLSHLAKLPVCELKIDRSFISSLEDNDAVRALVTAVIRIGESLKLMVVAEGVETVPQRRFLEALGCDMLQGYLFSRPLSSSDLVKWILARRAAAAKPAKLPAPAARRRAS